MIFIIVVGNEGDDFSRAFFPGMETGFELFVGETKEQVVESMLADPPKGKKVCWIENQQILDLPRGKEFVLSDDFLFVSKQKYHLMTVGYQSKDFWGEEDNIILEVFVPDSLANETVDMVFLESSKMFWDHIAERAFVRDDIKGIVSLNGRTRYFRVHDGDFHFSDNDE